jgi:exosortase
MATVVNQLPEQAAPSRPVPWAGIGWFSILLVAGYFPILKLLVWQWSTDDDVGHGFFVAPVAAYIAWQRRDRILQVAAKPAWWGIALILWGAVQANLGLLAAELFLQRSAFLISLVGVLLVLGGAGLVRELLYPLLLLPFMIPIPAVIFNQLTFPLQLFASQIAESTLGLLGIPVLRDGNVLELASQKLSVAEACSGIRSLLSLTFLSLVYAYFFDRKVWMRWVLFVGTIPIAIIANAGRVTVTGILSEVDAELATGFFHSLEGWIIFLIALVMMVGLHWLVNFTCRLKAGEESRAAEVS